MQKKEFCEEQPWKFLSILTDDALDRNDLQEAERFSAAMVIQPIKTAADLRRVGTLLRMKGSSGDWKDGLKLLKKSLPWTEEFLGPGAAVLLLCGGSQLLSGPQRAAHRGQSPPCSRLHRLPRKRPV
ncbi:MAG: hypothetical protein ACLUJG_16830 [Lawsonibacter sp.]